MSRVPFVGRLFWREYLALVGSLILICFEGFIRIITLGLPQPIIQFCYNRSRNAFNLFASPSNPKTKASHKSFIKSVANAYDFVDLCALFGYTSEEHIVHTGDGYLLSLHRLCSKRGETTHASTRDGRLNKKVVYLHHGLLMNSEVWVCLSEPERCLPFVLVEKGYDVWLGNNRDSKKSSRYSPASNAFWDFSMDQFAFHDIPDSIDYILGTTAQASLSYIGFSQGTAQAFASLSTHPKLNEKVNVFIGLAPAMAPSGLNNGVVDALMKASPEVLFLAFGRRSILSSATMWQSILYPPIFVHILDLSLSFLFNWSGRNISMDQKLAAYPHLYSFTSTKSVVHWFQIIRNKCFQMYDDDVQAPLSLGASDRYYKVAKYPTRNIKTPIVLLYGGSDSLVDIDVMLKELPHHTMAKEIPHFEHLDFLWASGVDTLVFPTVFEALITHAGSDRQIGGSIEYGIHNGRFSATDPRAFEGSSVSEDDASLSFDVPNDGSSIRAGTASNNRSQHGRRRSGSTSSARSVGGTKRIVKGGISLGSSKATTGMVSAASPPNKTNGRLAKADKQT